MRLPEITHLHIIVYGITALPEAWFSDTPLFLGDDRLDNAGHEGVMFYAQLFSISLMHSFLYAHSVRGFQEKVSGEGLKGTLPR